MIDVSFQADLLLDFHYGDDLKDLTPLIPRHCQCLLMSAASRFVITVSFIFNLSWDTKIVGN